MFALGRLRLPATGTRLIEAVRTETLGDDELITAESQTAISFLEQH
jgi:hypothetical protein